MTHRFPAEHEGTEAAEAPDLLERVAGYLQQRLAMLPTSVVDRRVDAAMLRRDFLEQFDHLPFVADVRRTTPCDAAQGGDLLFKRRQSVRGTGKHDDRVTSGRKARNDGKAQSLPNAANNDRS